MSTQTRIRDTLEKPDSPFVYKAYAMNMSHLSREDRWETMWDAIQNELQESECHSCDSVGACGFAYLVCRGCEKASCAQFFASWYVFCRPS